MASSPERQTTTPTQTGAVADDGFRPAPGAPTWDVRAVRRIMAKLSPEAAHMTAEGWLAVPWDQGVAVQRVMGRHFLRPGRAGRARDEWDALIRTDREHLRAHGLEIITPGSSQTLVRVPLPGQPQTVARVRRTGPLDAFARDVAFDGYEGIGGTLRFVSTHASARYQVADHEGTDVWVGNAGADDCVVTLAQHYGLPMPVSVATEPAR